MIRKILPTVFKQFVRVKVKELFAFQDNEHFKEQARLARVSQEQRMPKFNLESKHISNLSVLVDRDALLHAMPKRAVCAEIGVDVGEFTSRIIEITHPLKMHLVDTWGDPGRYRDELRAQVEAKFRGDIESGRVVIDVGRSTDVLTCFPDQYFDWVYLDTDHTYTTTERELNILKVKVKKGGIIAGHDYSVGNWIGDFRYGVIEAVHELCVLDGWEMIYVTFEANQTRSFAIRKLL